MNYTVSKINTKKDKEYIKEHHYSHGCHNGPSPCYGLFDKEELIGVLMFATPCSERVRASVFGEEYKNHITELHRLHILDCTPKNTESWFISRVMKKLKEDKPSIWAVVTFSDATEGHNGVIYKATNALFCGKTSKATFYLDEEGRLRHPRQNGVNITKDNLPAGWKPVKRESKNRFIYLLPYSKKHKKWMQKNLKFEVLDYEKE